MTSAGITAQSVLGKISEGHLECSICYNRFREPKLLNCLHTFCLKCLQNLRQCKREQDTKFPCPLCRRETTLTENDINGLPNNFTLSALVEEVEIQEQLLQGQESEIKCQACDEQNQAIAICMDCVHFMCQECQKAHERLTTLKSHKIYTLAQLRSGEIAYKSKLREDVPKCDTHPDQNLSIYCKTCEELVCTTCSILSHGNFKHSLVDLPEALSKCKQDVAEVVEAAESNKAKLIAAIDMTDRSRQRLDAMFADTNKKISEKAEKEIAKIREEELTLRQEAEKIYKERVKKFEAAHCTNSQGVHQAEHKLDEANRQLAQASCYEILKLKQTLLLNVQELTGIKSETMPDSLSFMDFRECEKSLGKLVLKDEPTLESKPEGTLLRPGILHPQGKWVLKTELRTFGPKHEFGGVYDVAVFSNNEIIMADYWCQQLISFLQKNISQSESPIIHVAKGLHIKDLNSPSRVAVNRDDQLVILDGPAVKIFNKQFKLLHQFMPSGGGPKSTPVCLAVDDQNLIAIGYQDREEISLHNPDGSLIRTLPAPLIDEHLTTSKKRLIYTSFKEQKLFSVDYRGGEVFSVSISSAKGENWGPTGVCCSEDGSIYVAVHGRPEGEIHHLSPNGVHIECAIRKCGFPHGIAFTPSGDLVVAAAHSVQVYHHV